MAHRKRSRNKSPRSQRDMSAEVHEYRFEVGRPDHGRRLDGFLAERLSWRSRTRVRAAIEGACVEVLPFKDPQQAQVGRLRAGLRLRAGQEVVVRLPSPLAEAGDTNSSELPDVPILFEDEHLLAVSKPPCVNVYPTRRHRAGSLIEWVHRRHQEEAKGGPLPTPCHRLDRETSGLLLFAKGRAARDGVQRQFEERSVRKLYLARVSGSPSSDSGRIDWPIEPDDESPVEIRQRARPGGGGKPALTLWKVRERSSEASLIELELCTGRQHQLRVHLAALGHPILGDKLYLGGDDIFLRSLTEELTEDDADALVLPRQALHAWRLAIEHPVGADALELEAPLWPDLVG